MSVDCARIAIQWCNSTHTCNFLLSGQIKVRHLRLPTCVCMGRRRNSRPKSLLPPAIQREESFEGSSSSTRAAQHTTRRNVCACVCCSPFPRPARSSSHWESCSQLSGSEREPKRFHLNGIQTSQLSPAFTTPKRLHFSSLRQYLSKISRSLLFLLPSELESGRILLSPSPSISIAP